MALEALRGRYAETCTQLKQLLILALFLGWGGAQHLPFPFGWRETREHMFWLPGLPAQSPAGARPSVRRRLSPGPPRQCAWRGLWCLCRGAGWVSFSHEILPDFHFAICLKKFCKSVYGNGCGWRWGRGQGKMRGTEVPRHPGPPCWVVGRERHRGESTWDFSGNKFEA